MKGLLRTSHHVRSTVQYYQFTGAVNIKIIPGDNNMRRYAILLLILAMIIFSACAPKSQTDEDQSASSGQPASSTEASTGPGNAPGGPMAGGPADQDTSPSHEAQDMLRSGDVEAAIAILENMSVGEPPSPELSAQLVDAHIMYVQQIAMTRTTSPQVLNEVLYCHYGRILELDPENEEAIAGLAAVQMWFETHGMILPEEIDPLKFLPDLVSDDSSENSGFLAGDEEPDVIE